jgi:hypothetical protein
MPAETFQPKMELAHETLTFTRSDTGKSIQVSLLTDILDDADMSVPGALQWALMMQLQGVMEYQEILAKQNATLAESMNKLAEALRTLVDKASETPKLPDTAEIMRKTFEDLGLPPDMLKQALAGMAGGMAGVTMPPVGTNGGAK